MLGSGPIFETIRTVQIPDTEALKVRIDGLRSEVEQAGRAPEDVEIVVTGNWPFLDVRRGWDTDDCLAEVAELKELGADWIVVTICGDDAGAAEDTVRRFGEEIVTVTREQHR
jgi:hypothetical protein